MNTSQNSTHRFSVQDLPEFHSQHNAGQGHTIIIGPTSKGMTVASDLLQSQIEAAGGVVHVMDVGQNYGLNKTNLGK